MKKIDTKKGKRRTVWMPNSLDHKAELTRKKLGLSLSAFYRFAIVELVKQSQIQKNTKEEKPNDV